MIVATKDVLYHGLPAILVRDRYLVYSPYCRKFVYIEEHQLHEPVTFEKLNRNGFFAKPVHGTPYGQKKKGAITVVLAVTKRCNLKCVYCFANSGPGVGNHMASQAAADIIENISKRHNLATIHFIGGEPTLNFAAIRSVKEKADEIGLNPNFYITTNGIVPKPILNWLVNKGFIFKISWDGLVQGQTRMFRGGQNSSARVEQTITYLVDKGCNFCVRMTVTKSNLPYLPESIQKCAGMGAKFFHVEPMSPDGRGNNVQNEVPDPKEFIEIFSKIITVAEDKGVWLINSALANLFSPKDYFCCSLRNRVYHFNPNGSVSLCYKAHGKDDALSKRFTAGNYEIQKNQLSVYQNDTLVNRLAILNAGVYSSCRDCFLRFVCSGGCPFWNFKANHVEDDVDPWTCQIRMGILRMAILHIYERALEGKGSCLEGSIRFYRHIRPRGKVVKDSSEADKVQALDICI